MHTGDLATIDAEGYGNIVGRIKDMVIAAARTSIPARSRNICSAPQMQEVQVFGVADERTAKNLCLNSGVRAGETLTAEALRAFCEGQIAHNKIPRYVEFVSEFPRPLWRGAVRVEFARGRARR